jgi:hypothetical protein
MLLLKVEGPLMPRTKKPVSEKQLEANRGNAAQSTGSRSPEGKARSAQSTRKHGFTASTFAVVRLTTKSRTEPTKLFILKQVTFSRRSQRTQRTQGTQAALPFGHR